MGNVITGMETDEEAPKALIPKGYRLIAVRETNGGRRVGELYVNPDSRLYYLVVSGIGKSAGPFTKEELAMLGDMINDAGWMGNNYTFLESRYD